VKGKNNPAVNWLNDTALEHFFTGYHLMNCMLSLLKRKQELKDILVKESKVGNNLYDQLKKDLDEIMLLDRTKMLGKEYTLGKNSNPLLEQN
jgi:hypothetical protein